VPIGGTDVPACDVELVVASKGLLTFWLEPADWLDEDENNDCSAPSPDDTKPIAGNMGLSEIHRGLARSELEPPKQQQAVCHCKKSNEIGIFADALGPKSRQELPLSAEISRTLRKVPDAC
jgi:hypothetical protein